MIKPTRTRLLHVGRWGLVFLIATSLVLVEHLTRRHQNVADEAARVAEDLLASDLSGLAVLVGVLQGTSAIEPDPFRVMIESVLPETSTLSGVLLAESCRDAAAQQVDDWHVDAAVNRDSGSATDDHDCEFEIRLVEPRSPELVIYQGLAPDRLMNCRADVADDSGQIPIRVIKPVDSQRPELHPGTLLVRQAIQYIPQGTVTEQTKVAKSNVRALLIGILDPVRLSDSVAARMRLAPGSLALSPQKLPRPADEPWAVRRSLTALDGQLGLVLSLRVSPRPSPGEAGSAALLGLAATVLVASVAHFASQRRRELNDLRRQLQVATESAGVGTWDLDPRSGKLWWDARMYAMYDVAPGTPATYDTWYSRVHEEDRDAAGAAFSVAMSEQTKFEYQFRVRMRNGAIRHIKATALPVVGSGGELERMIGANEDVTETVRALSGLRDAQELAKVGNWTYEIERGEISWSPELYRIFGRDPALGPPDLEQAMDGYDEESRVRLSHAIERAIGHGDEYTLLLRTTGHGARDRKFVRTEGRVRRSAAGEITGLFGIAQDVTEQTQRERSLSDVLTALDSTTDSVFLFDAETGRFVYTNQAAQTQLGYAPMELSAMKSSDVLPEHAVTKFEEHLDTLRKHPEMSVVYRTVHHHRAGHEIPVEVSLQLAPDLGERGRFVAVVRDISATLAAEARLSAARDAAEQASRAKSEFLANMSHEIRTPMTAILGYAELMSTDPEFRDDPSRLHTGIDTIRRNAQHLITVINDILDMSKIEAGQLEVERLAFSPITIAEDVLTILRPKARQKNLELELRADEALPDTIVSDPTRLRQILLNLIGNAVKFTEVGSVTLQLRCDAQRELMHFDVVDSGVGMSTEQLERIREFRAFAQADSSMSRRFGGTGLGLRISNELATLLGGSLEIDSTLGEGSTFRVTIATGPLASESLHSLDTRAAERPTEQAKASPSDLAILVDSRVLLVEDGMDNRRLISFYLDKAGARVDQAENGQIAVDMLRDTDREALPDLILMDMQMPVLDGYGATEALRNAGIEVPIVAITAHAMAEDRRRCLAAGCDDYLTKPIRRDILLETCARWLSGRSDSGRHAVGAARG